MIRTFCYLNINFNSVFITQQPLSETQKAYPETNTGIMENGYSKPKIRVHTFRPIKNHLPRRGKEAILLLPRGNLHEGNYLI